MAEYVMMLVVLGFLAWVMWSVAHLRYVFLVRIDKKGPRVCQGKVTPAFLSEIAQACQGSGVARGWVGGVKRGRKVALVFSRHFPRGCQQQLRNLWQL
jgi:hypothetical protein